MVTSALFVVHESSHHLQLARNRVVLSASGGIDSEPTAALASFSAVYDEDSNTVVQFSSPRGQLVTLIGTAHLSQKSNEQVERILKDQQPQAIMVELDPSRLPRIGIASTNDIQVSKVRIADQQIMLPVGEDLWKIDSSQQPWSLLLLPMWNLQKALTRAISQAARLLLTNTYQVMGKDMQAKAGGEFLVAIRQAEDLESCSTLVLGDRSSVTTIQRAATLALQSGDPWGVLQRFQQVNQQEMKSLENQIRDELTQGGVLEIPQSNVTVAVMEAMKTDPSIRNRLFQNLEQNVPEFTRTFLNERDYIMAEAIRCVIDEDPGIQNIVGVVGVGHLPGMQENLQAMWSNATLPLVRDYREKDTFH